MRTTIKKAWELNPGDEILLPDQTWQCIGAIHSHFNSYVLSWVRPTTVLSMAFEEVKMRGINAHDKFTVRVVDTIIRPDAFQIDAPIIREGAM